MMLGWSREDLASKSAVSTGTVWNFERGTVLPQRSTVKLLTTTFRAHGIVFDPPEQDCAEVQVDLCVLSDGSRVRRSARED